MYTLKTRFIFNKYIILKKRVINGFKANSLKKSWKHHVKKIQQLC